MSQGFVNPQTITLPVPVADGGTGRATATAYAVLCGGTTSTGAHQSIASVGTSGQVLTSNGAGALPTFQTSATTSWVAYTPTFTGFGTPTSVNFYSRKNGDMLEIQGRFVAGTTTATEAQITIGYNGSSANVSSNSSIIAALSVCGNLIQTTVGANGFYPLIESNKTYVVFGATGTSRAATTKLNGNDFATGATISFQAFIPVTVWP
jgi:hypothetical protein